MAGLPSRGTTAAKEVFISYGREEEVKKFVRKLKRDLESAGIAAWLDVDDIPAGSEWPNEIGLALRNCQSIIAVLTKKYAGSHYCKNELYVACSKQKQIFPVVYEDGWDDSDKGAGVSYMVAAYNWAMFRPKIDNYDASIRKLIEGMKGRSEGRSPSQLPTAGVKRRGTWSFSVYIHFSYTSHTHQYH